LLWQARFAAFCKGLARSADGKLIPRAHANKKAPATAGALA
jgi:hypothetical protein